MVGGKINLFFPLDLVAMCWGKALWGTVEPHCLNYAKKTKTKTKSSLPYISGKAGPLSDSWETLIASEGELWIWGWSHSGLW